MDLLAHPLASHPQAYNSPNAILAFLRQQAQGPFLKENTKDRWINSLNPTVEVLFSFSAALESIVGPVCSRQI